MTSKSLRLARNAWRSAGELTPRELWFFTVEPLAPTTRLAEVLTGRLLQLSIELVGPFCLQVESMAQTWLACEVCPLASTCVARALQRC